MALDIRDVQPPDGSVVTTATPVGCGITVFTGYGHPPNGVVSRGPTTNVDLGNGVYGIYGMAQFLAVGTYFWWVTTDYGSSPTYSFTVIQANRAPTATIGAPSGTISTTSPNFIINFSDPDTGDNGKFAAYQIQVQRKSDGSSFWDLGWVATNAGQQADRSATVAYGGTALVNTTEYEWRARVQDGAGAQGAYTAWKSFTPFQVPGAPTSLQPSGQILTLTPTFKGVYQQASGATESRFQYRIWQNTVEIYSSGDVNAPIATGEVYGGAPALSWGTQYSVDARSKDTAGVYGPWSAKVPFTTKGIPTTPTGLSPSGGAVTPDTTPTLAWTHNDPQGAAQTAADIELYDLTADAYITGYDAKTLSQAGGTHTVTETLTLTHDYQWRVRTKGESAPGYGPWSAWQQFSVATAPSVALTSPTVAQVLNNGSLTVTWTFSGGSGTQQDYQIVLYDDAGAVLWDSGQIAGVDVAVPVPGGILHNNRSYAVQGTVRDTLGQMAVTSPVPFTTSWTPPDPVTGLVAIRVGGVGGA